MNSSNLTTLPDGTDIGGYRLLSVLGVGGFGVTYKARKEEIGLDVAIKEYMPNQFAVRDGTTVHPKSDGSGADFEWGLQRFLEEARTLARFPRHPNIVRITDYFEANNTAYIVMEYEDGEPLDELLRRLGTLTEEQLKYILLPIADGLGAVHREDVLHRDIKPANIFVRRMDGSPVLLDFGAARSELGVKSENVDAIVSPPYSPPEQYYSGGEQGPYTDIYALSALCYSAITGKPPPESPNRLAQRHRRGDPLRRLVEMQPPGYSTALLEAVDWGLQLNEEDRPQSVDEWLREIEARTGEAEQQESHQLEEGADEPEYLEPEEDMRSVTGLPPEAGVIKKLVRGHYGLANTYWRFGVLVGVFYALVYEVAFTMFLDSSVFEDIIDAYPKELPDTIHVIYVLLPLIFAAYQLAVVVGVWRAARVYQGAKIWSVLARLAALFTGVMATVMVYNHVREDIAEELEYWFGETELVRSLTVRNSSTQDVVIVQVVPTRVVSLREESFVTLDATVSAGATATVHLKSIHYSNDCKFDIRLETAEDVYEASNIDMCPLGVVNIEGDEQPNASFHIETVPADAQVRILDVALAYRDGMDLPPGDYRVAVSAQGYHEKVEVVSHGVSPTTHRITLDRVSQIRGQPFTVRTGPPDARVQIMNIEPRYRAGIELPRGSYDVRVTANGFDTIERTLLHGDEPTDQWIGLPFRDCPVCPKMVEIPTGKYTMGTSRGAERYPNEGPAHEVEIRYRISVGMFEVSFAEWDACVRDGGCERQLDDLGRGRGRHPVVHARLSDARAYAHWLSVRTGRRYRLLSEAEWEYAARAGTKSDRFWDQAGGQTANQCAHANGADRTAAGEYSRWITASCSDGYVYAAPSNEARFEPNGWGLYRMLGNVTEWTEDCWHGSYAGASKPRNGNAWTTECEGPWHVGRGGSWSSIPRGTRAPIRRKLDPSEGVEDIGFRVAVEIN